MKFEKILFHTRFREQALNSLKAILELKKAGLKEVILTHIIPREEFAFSPYSGYLKEKEEEFVELAKIHFEEWQKDIKAKNIQSKIRVEVGAANVKIL